MRVMMSKLIGNDTPSEFIHTDLTACANPDHCGEGLHIWPGGAPGPVVP